MRLCFMLAFTCIATGYPILALGSQVTETGVVDSIDVYGVGASSMVHIKNGSPYGAIDCYGQHADIVVGDQVQCVGTYVSSPPNQWITNATIIKQPASPSPRPIATSTPTPSGQVDEKGAVNQINIYGTSRPGSMLVVIKPGSPYTKIDCFSPNSSQFHIGDLVECIGQYHLSGSHWIIASSLSLQGASPSPSPTPLPTIPTKHVLTAGYDKGISPMLIAPWLSWASTTYQANLSVRAAGIKVMYYTDPNRVANSDNFYPYVSGNESNFAHDCSGNRITSLTYGQYLMDPGVDPKSTIPQAWHSFIASRTSSTVKWDAIFEDDANDVKGVNVLPCHYTVSAWLTASQAENAYQSPTPIIYNGLSIAGEMALNSSTNVIGGMEEGCYSDSVRFPKAGGSSWTQIENTEIAMAQQGKLFICLGRDSTSASSSADGRIYTYASFLLAYTLSSSILWEQYATPSGFRVMPETQLVALNPLVPTPNDISSLQLPSGVYGREYGSCYLNGVSVGQCAVVVNNDPSNAHAYPYGTKYKHSLQLAGSGILDGGLVVTNGAAPPSSIPNLAAVIVFK